MGKIGLAKAIALVREEVLQAAQASNEAGVRFPLGQITLSFQVGITASGTGSVGFDLWVLELGAEGSYAHESVQTVTVNLEPPVGPDGRPIKVASGSNQLPA